MNSLGLWGFAQELNTKQITFLATWQEKEISLSRVPNFKTLYYILSAKYCQRYKNLLIKEPIKSVSYVHPTVLSPVSY